MGCPVDCSNGLSADYSDGLSGRLSGGLHCPAGQSLEWSLDSLRKIVPVSTMKFYNFPDYCPVRTMWGTVKTSYILYNADLLEIPDDDQTEDAISYVDDIALLAVGNDFADSTRRLSY